MERAKHFYTEPATDPVRQYLNEIGRYPLLTKEQEVELTNTYHQGIEAQQLIEEAFEQDQLPENFDELELMAQVGHEARNTMITSNLRLTVSIAKRYQNNGMPLLDLISEGNIGLARAVDKFDPSKGFKFSTYATWWIRQAVTRAIGEQGKTIRTPMHLHESIYSLKRAEREVVSEIGYSDDELLCKRLGITKEKLRERRRYMGQTAISSLDQTIGDEGDSTLGDLVPDSTSGDDYDDTEKQNMFELLWEKIDDILNEQQKDVIALRFGLFDNSPHTLEQIGEMYGLTRERIRQIEQRSLTMLRRAQLGISVDEYVS